MRRQFVKCNTRYQAMKECPWAEKTMKVCEGFICFESADDYKIAKNQK